ncbi:hypothetical protein [Streptomyces sp. NPDC006285]|uniref:hypothetical protein n=1 Tax=Streptomyces sp. NPDC006285 TaxID=3364742 RepID=UPI0036D1AF11
MTVGGLHVGTGAAHGFWVTPDIYEDGIDAFVDEVVPILQERGIYPTEYPRLDPAREPRRPAPVRTRPTHHRS